MLHIYGMAPGDIAAEVGMTMPGVGRVLKDPRAQRAIEALRKRMLGNAMQTIQDRMTGMGIQAVKNIRTTINGTFEDGTKAKMHQDDVSFELLARIGFGRKESSSDGAGIQLPKEEARALVAAVEKANKAREIHSNAEEVDIVVESAGLEQSSDGGGLGETNGRDGDKQEEI